MNMNRYNCSFNISRYAVLLIFCIVCFVTNHLVCGTSVDGGLLVSEMKNRQETDQKKISNGILSKSMAHKSPNKMTEAMKRKKGNINTENMMQTTQADQQSVASDAAPESSKQINNVQNNRMCRVYDVNNELKYKEYSSKLACESSCNSNTDEQRRCLWDNIIIRERPSDEAKKSNSMKEYGEYLGKTPLYEFQAVAYEVKIKSKHTCNEMNRIERVDASCKNIVDFFYNRILLAINKIMYQTKIILFIKR